MNIDLLKDNLMYNNFENFKYEMIILCHEYLLHKFKYIKNSKCVFYFWILKIYGKIFKHMKLAYLINRIVNHLTYEDFIEYNITSKKQQAILGDYISPKYYSYASPITCAKYINNNILKKYLIKSLFKNESFKK